MQVPLISFQNFIHFSMQKLNIRSEFQTGRKKYCQKVSNLKFREKIQTLPTFRVRHWGSNENELRFFCKFYIEYMLITTTFLQILLRMSAYYDNIFANFTSNSCSLQYFCKFYLEYMLIREVGVQCTVVDWSWPKLERIMCARGLQTTRRLQVSALANLQMTTGWVLVTNVVNLIEQKFPKVANK